MIYTQALCHWRASALLLVLLALLGSAGLVRAAGEQQSTTVPTLLETIVPGYEPWGLARDHTGHIWVAEPECDPSIYSQPVCPSSQLGNLLVYTAASFHPGAPATHIYHEPAGYSSPFFVAVDNAENIWFSQPVSNALGELDHLGTWHQWSLPVPAASPFDLTIDQYGHIWFSEPGISAIGEFTPANGHFLSFPTPSAQSDPYGIAGPDPSTGSLWFSENNSLIHRIGRLSPTAAGGIGGQGIQEYLVPATNHDTPHLLSIDTRGSIWWSEGWAGQIGQLIIAQARPQTSAGIHEYRVPAPACPASGNCAVHISGIAAAPDGRIWFDDSLSSRFGSYTPGGHFTMYTLEGSLSSGSHPHDGLIVDASGNLWLSEEFGNRLVKIIEPHSTPTPGSTRVPPSHATPSSARSSECADAQQR